MRHSLPLLFGVFVVAAGIGTAVTVLLEHGSSKPSAAKHLTVARAKLSKPRSASKPARSASRGPSASSGTLLTASAADNFAALQAKLPGQVGVAVAPLGQGSIQTLGPLQAGYAWSTMKVPVLVTLMRDLARTGQSLSAEEQSDATLALEQSDNAAADALFGVLEDKHGGLVPASQAVGRTLAAAGDATTVNTAPNYEGFTTWGHTVWSPTDEILFYRALARGCLLSPAGTGYVLHLMRNVIPVQRWGAGAAGYPLSVPLAFKAGWGPENVTEGYFVRQTAIVGSGERGYLVSMLAHPDDGTFTEGVAMITALATWARHNIPLRAGTPAGCTGAS